MTVGRLVLSWWDGMVFVVDVVMRRRRSKTFQGNEKKCSLSRVRLWAVRLTIGICGSWIIM
jgi:hypothetical protein